jgi:cytochrome c oxidase subunit 1
VSAISVPAGAGAIAAAELTLEQVRDRTKALVLRYVLTSSAILLVGGALGGILRQSQAGVVTLQATTWYEIMTAHGLASFVGWGAFALMGISFWVLTESGFHVRGWGYRWAVLSWWLMVLGVVGVVITVLAEHFAGSWVFLYPLPFHSGGEWSEATAGFFSFSVILVGLSIFAYCFGVLAVVTGTELGARPGAGAFNRLMCAMGMGHVHRLSRRYHTDRPLPFAVIPLTVIAIDMIIATAPLAVLLILMVVQSVQPSVTVDPLLAKAMLWWFGHPVVYLLLFPAVAVYYHIIPKLAKRELVAGHIIAIAWGIAAITNVIIGFHHMYTDFPTGVTESINTFSQPMTYAVTIPSAISLFSLGFTMYRADFDWSNPAGKFLAAALASWVVAGFQGVALATIAYDQYAHNSLWVVGHFHNMALIHIGVVIFAAIYYFLPELVGRPWYSKKLADWHLVLLLVGGYGMVMPWLMQGMNGAPRRFAVLESQYKTMSVWSLPFIALIIIGTGLWAYNVIRTLGITWLSRAVGPKPLDDRLVTATPREEPSAVLASLVAALGIAVSLASLWSSPFLWAPLGILAGFVAVTMGARRQGAWTMLISLLLLVVGALPAILGAF